MANEAVLLAGSHSGYLTGPPVRHRNGLDGLTLILNVLLAAFGGESDRVLPIVVGGFVIASSALAFSRRRGPAA